MRIQNTAQNIKYPSIKYYVKQCNKICITNDNNIVVKFYLLELLKLLIFKY